MTGLKLNIIVIHTQRVQKICKLLVGLGFLYIIQRLTWNQI